MKIGKASWIEFKGQWYYQLWDGNLSWTCDGGQDDEWEAAGATGSAPFFDAIEYIGGPRQTVPPPPKLDRRGRPGRQDGAERIHVTLSRWHRTRLDEIAGELEMDRGRAIERLIDNHKKGVAP